MQLEYASCEPESMQCSSCRLTASLYHKGVLHILPVAAHLVCMQLTTVSSLLTLSIFAAASAVPCGPRHCHDNKRPDQWTDTDHRPDRPDTQGTRESPQTDLTVQVCIDSKHIACLLLFLWHAMLIARNGRCHNSRLWIESPMRKALACSR